MEVVDPFMQLSGEDLRAIVVHCVDWGRLSLPVHAGERMEERHITGGEIISALCSGTLRTDQRVAGRWRYLARRRHVEICFTFEVDEDGNLLVIVTMMRKDDRT